MPTMLRTPKKLSAKATTQKLPEQRMTEMPRTVNLTMSPTDSTLLKIESMPMPTQLRILRTNSPLLEPLWLPHKKQPTTLLPNKLLFKLPLLRPPRKSRT